MKVSSRTRYALRFLVRLATDRTAAPLPLSRAARREGISSKYLSRLVIPLRWAALVEPSAGARGGDRLAAPPGRISVRKVVAIFESGDRLAPCLEGGGCRLARQCRTRLFWKSLDRDIARKLSRTTIADLAHGPMRPTL